MKFDKKTLSETIESELSGNKYFTKGKKQNIVMNESQLERLLMTVNENNAANINNIITETFKIIREAIVKENLDLSVEDYSETIISEAQDEWRGHNPGASAAAGIENIINSVKKAYDMIKDSDTRRKLANSITKLGNFMTYTAELMGSGASQRTPRSYEDVSDDLPYPELEETDVDVELEEGSVEELEKRVDDVEGEVQRIKSLKESKIEKERRIQEDIKMMKQIISPISRI